MFDLVLAISNYVGHVSIMFAYIPITSHLIHIIPAVVVVVASSSASAGCGSDTYTTKNTLTTFGRTQQPNYVAEYTMLLYYYGLYHNHAVRDVINEHGLSYLHGMK
jgi:hypothetical protein